MLPWNETDGQVVLFSKHFLDSRNDREEAYINVYAPQEFSSSFNQLAESFIAATAPDDCGPTPQNLCPEGDSEPPIR